MAKAKRERRSSIRTMETGGASELLDRLDALENEEKARRAALEGHSPEAASDDDGDPSAA